MSGDNGILISETSPDVFSVIHWQGDYSNVIEVLGSDLDLKAAVRAARRLMLFDIVEHAIDFKFLDDEQTFVDAEDIAQAENPSEVDDDDES